MKIDELLDKYFEGETSCEEERELRRFFTEEEVPEHLQTYRPLFAYLNREATSMAEPTEEKSVTTESAKEVPTQRKPSRLYRTFYAVSGIAAGLHIRPGRGQYSPGVLRLAAENIPTIINRTIIGGILS